MYVGSPIKSVRWIVYVDARVAVFIPDSCDTCLT